MSPDPTKVIKDDESLQIFVRSLAKFDKAFCDAMASGEDFTLRIECHGNKGEILHCRVFSDGFERPAKAEKRIEDKLKFRKPA